MPRIESIFAFVTEDTGPDDEGIIGFNSGIGWVPMVGADMARVESLRPMAQRVANETGKPIKVLKFEIRFDIDKILPKDKGGEKIDA